MTKKNEMVKLQIIDAEDAKTDNSPTNYFLTNYTPPSNARRLNLPPLIKCSDVPVGATLTGELVAVVENFTKQEKMSGSKVLHLKTKQGAEFLFPMTGVIRHALQTGPDGKICEPTEYIGEELFITRLPDGLSGKYKKSMFKFDVYVGK